MGCREERRSSSIVNLLSLQPTVMMSSNQHVQYRAPPLPRPQYLQSDQQQQEAASYQQHSASTSSSSSHPSNQSQAYPQWQQHFPSNSFPSSNNSPETLDQDTQESKPVVRKGGRASAANSASATGKRKERIHYSCEYNFAHSYPYAGSCWLIRIIVTRVRVSSREDHDWERWESMSSLEEHALWHLRNALVRPLLSVNHHPHIFIWNQVEAKSSVPTRSCDWDSE